MSGSACSWASCQDCGGCTAAWERDDEDQQRDVCPDCDGSGTLSRLITDDLERLVPCEECGGKGYYSDAA